MSIFLEISHVEILKEEALEILQPTSISHLLSMNLAALSRSLIP